MKIQTARFGSMEVTEEHLIHFRDGMIGFSTLKNYVLVESPSMPLVLWLQSTERPGVAFPLIEPWFFKRDYKVTLSDADKVSIKLEEGDRTKIFDVLTIPEDMTKMTVNLKAPIVINLDKSAASQVILQDKTLEVRAAAHEAFNKALANFNLSQSATDAGPSEESIWNAVAVKKEVETAL